LSFWLRYQDRMRLAHFDGVAVSMARAVGARRDEKLFDIGGGTGVLTEYFAQGFGEVAIVEPNARRRRYGEKRRPALRFHDARAEHLPFAAASFDCVTAVGSFHHVKDQAAAANEAFRVLRPGGRIVIFEYNEAKGSGHRRSFDMVAGHLHFMGPGHLEAILKKASFRSTGVIDLDEGFILTAIK